eukprot:6372222-Pyramimonas_sp.AAC.1
MGKTKHMRDDVREAHEESYCFWVRGLVPLEWTTGVVPSVEEIVSAWDANATYWRTRRCGWAIVHIKLGSFKAAGVFCGTLPGPIYQSFSGAWLVCSNPLLEVDSRTRHFLLRCQARSCRIWSLWR